MIRKWLFAEAIICMLPAMILLLSALPAIGFGLFEVIGTVAGDSRPVLARIYAVLPYVAGMLGLIILWRYVAIVAAGGVIRLGLLFWIAVGAGVVACKEVFAIAPLVAQVLVCAPLWVLIAHLLLLSGRNNVGTSR